MPFWALRARRIEDKRQRLAGGIAIGGKQDTDQNRVAEARRLNFVMLDAHGDSLVVFEKVVSRLAGRENLEHSDRAEAETRRRVHPRSVVSGDGPTRPRFGAPF